MAKEYIDLLLDNGELVRVEHDPEHTDEIHEAIENTMKREDWWGVATYEGTSATYRGIRIERVNMKRVVAML